MKRCPKCQSIFIDWDGYNECFTCLQKDCMHMWTLKSAPEWKLENPVENVYLQTTLPWEFLNQKGGGE